MTTEERFERIENITASLFEERRRDREEYKMLWRETQRQIDGLAVETRRLGDRVDQIGDRIERLAEESRAADRQLAARIDSLVSAIGQLINRESSNK